MSFFELTPHLPPSLIRLSLFYPGKSMQGYALAKDAGIVQNSHGNRTQ